MLRGRVRKDLGRVPLSRFTPTVAANFDAEVGGRFFGTHLAAKYTRAHYRGYFGSEFLSQQSHDSSVAAGDPTAAAGRREDEGAS